MDNILADKYDFLDDFNSKAIARHIATRLKQKRLYFNMTQQALAMKSGVSLATLKRFESSGEISLKHLLMLAVVLQSTQDFKNLFPELKYQSIDEVLEYKKKKTRKRGRLNE